MAEKPPLAVPAVVQRDAPREPILTEEVGNSPAIVSPKSQKELKQLRHECAYERALAIDDPEALARVRALIKRMGSVPRAFSASAMA